MRMPASKTAIISGAKTTKTDEKQIESEVLSAIEAESHRTGAIVNILHRRYAHNAILKALVSLKKEGKVEKESKKAWIAKGKLGGKGKESGKSKESGKGKESAKEKETSVTPEKKS